MSKIAIVRGSKNIWRDFDYADADVRKAKTVLAAKIITELKRRDLSDRAAAKHIEGIDHSDISRIRNAELKRYTVDRLIRTLSQMNCRVDVSVKTIRKSQIAKSRTALA
ncbi:MAG: XRE family transcriptional regulator [Gammaproteobacteria bacterium]|nr:MAG: XRE family transcriptional regulator [Gammaproteobacteria bacterium]